MSASGMSATAIRRALGLSETDAVACGLVSPKSARPAFGVGPGATAGGCGPGRAGPSMMDVVDAVARACDLGRQDLLGRGQIRLIARARHLVMYLLRELCPGASLPTIGYLLDRDHTTVLYGCRRAEALLARDAAFSELARRARRELAP